MTHFDSILRDQPRSQSGVKPRRSKWMRAALMPALLSSFAVLGGCGDAKTETGTSNTTAVTSEYMLEGDYIMGQETAPVTVVEYASVACPHCANWHQSVFPDFKAEWVDTGKVKYIFRPFPTSPAQVADTGHMLAYCAPREKYFKNIKRQFDRQAQIFEMMKAGKLRETYINLAKASGLNEKEFIACLSNPDIQAHYKTVIQSGQDMGVTGTPSFFINGEKASVFDMDSLRKVVLPLLGEELPVETKPESAQDDTGHDTSHNHDASHNEDAPH